MRFIIVTLLALILIGCGSKRDVSYRTDIQPILNERCVRCHNTEVQRGKVSLASYDDLMHSLTRSGKKPPVIAGQPNESRLYILAATSQVEFRMPPDTSNLPPLHPDQLKLIARWIMQGAKDN